MAVIGAHYDGVAVELLRERGQQAQRSAGWLGHSVADLAEAGVVACWWLPGWARSTCIAMCIALEERHRLAVFCCDDLVSGCLRQYPVDAWCAYVPGALVLHRWLRPRDAISFNIEMSFYKLIMLV